MSSGLKKSILKDIDDGELESFSVSYKGEWHKSVLVEQDEEEWMVLLDYHAEILEDDDEEEEEDDSPKDLSDDIDDVDKDQTEQDDD